MRKLWKTLIPLATLTILSCGCIRSESRAEAKQEKQDKQMLSQQNIDVNITAPDDICPDAPGQTRIKLGEIDITTDGRNNVNLGNQKSEQQQESSELNAKYEAAKQKVTILYVIGGLAILAGIAASVFVGTRIGIPIAIGGAGLLLFMTFIDTAPWWAIALICLIPIGAAAYWIYEHHTKNTEHTVLTDLIGAIDLAGDEVKAELAKLKAERPAAYERIKATVAKIKTELRG
jgi:hypothetical protein